MHQLSSLLYISLAPSTADEQTVRHILTGSHRRNAALGISGALLSHAGFYMQVLEGERQVVHELYQRIRRDSRHFDARIAAVETLARRQFGGRPMHNVPAPRCADGTVGECLRGLWRGNRGIDAHNALALLRRMADAASASSPSAVPAHH